MFNRKRLKHGNMRQDNRDILEALLVHLDVAGMAEAFVRIVAADEQSLPNVPAESLAWLADTGLLPKLLSRYGSTLQCVQVPTWCFASHGFQ